MTSKLLQPLLVVLAVLTVPGAVRAGEPTAADRATARQLMLEGRNLRFDGDLKSALEKFEAADALMGVPTTGLELARTQAKLGMLVEALDSCARVIRHAARRGEPPPFQQAREDARKLRDELRERTPYLRFVLPAGGDASQIELRVDGVLIPPEAFQTPRLVNPGKHEVEVRVGRGRRVISVVVNESDAREVALELPRKGQAEPTQPAQPERRSPWVWGGFATAAVGGTVGSVSGLLAWSERNKLDDACPSRTCSPNETDRLDRARRYATVSTYAFILGGIGAAVGVGALLTSDDENDRGVSVTPCTDATVCVRGSF